MKNKLFTLTNSTSNFDTVINMVTGNYKPTAKDLFPNKETAHDALSEFKNLISGRARNIQETKEACALFTEDGVNKILCCRNEYNIASANVLHACETIITESAENLFFLITPGLK